MDAPPGAARETAMWLALVIDSFRWPRRAAERLIALDIGPGTLVEAAVAVTCVGIVLGYAALRLAGGAVDPVSALVLATPLAGAAAQLVTMALVVFLTFRVGRLFGGVGGLRGAGAVVVWLSAVALGLQAVQLAALALAPPVAGLIGVATLVWLAWAFASFVAALHEFRSAVVVLGAVALTAFALMLGLTVIAAILGITPQGME